MTLDALYRSDESGFCEYAGHRIWKRRFNDAFFAWFWLDGDFFRMIDGDSWRIMERRFLEETIGFPPELMAL